MAKREINPICIPENDNETVIEILSGARWNASYPRWEWTYLQYWWDTSPAFCGKCGRCTNLSNIAPCGHEEAKRKLRGQIFISNLSEHEKRQQEGGLGRTTRYVRYGKTIGAAEAKKEQAAFL